MSMGLGGVCQSLQPSNLALFDEERGWLWASGLAATYNYRRRNLANVGRYEGAPFFELWPSSGISGVSSGLTYLGMDANHATWDRTWEPHDMGTSGINRPYFIRGTVQDAGGNPLGGAVIEAFRTSDNALMGVCASDATGYYQCPTADPVSAHFLVAYYSSAPALAGSTVNTLTPAL